MRDTSVIDHYLAPLRPFLAPQSVTEVVVNRPGEVGVEHPDGWRWHEVPELTETWLRTLAVAAAAYTGQDGWAKAASSLELVMVELDFASTGASRR